MFGPLLAITSVALVAQGAWELFARNHPLGAVLMVVGLLMASVGATAAPYVKEIERRRRGRG
jgi:urea transporter